MPGPPSKGTPKGRSPAKQAGGDAARKQAAAKGKAPARRAGDNALSKPAATPGGEKPPAKVSRAESFEESAGDLVISPTDSAANSPETGRRRSKKGPKPPFSTTAGAIFAKLGPHRRLPLVDEQAIMEGIKTLEADSRHGRRMIKRSFSASEQFKGTIAGLEDEIGKRDAEIEALKAASAKKDKEIDALKEALVHRGKENTELQGQHEEVAERLKAKADHAMVSFGCTGRVQTDTKVDDIPKHVAAAAESVSVCCYALSDAAFAAALCQAGTRGAQVRVLVDLAWLQEVSGNGTAPLDSVASFARLRKQLRSAGVQIGGQRGQKKRGKHKVTYEAYDGNCICVDHATLIVGSHRFAEDGQRTDHTFAIISHGEEAGRGVNDFATVFEQLWVDSMKPK